MLSRGLVARGHDVTLFAAPGSESDAVVVEVLDEAQPDNIEDSLIEATYVGAVFDRIDAARRAGKPFDVIHDHCPAVALAMADRLQSRSFIRSMARSPTIGSSFTAAKATRQR